MGFLLSVSEMESVPSLFLPPLLLCVGHVKVLKQLLEAAPLNPLGGMPDVTRCWVLMAFFWSRDALMGNGKFAHLPVGSASREAFPCGGEVAGAVFDGPATAGIWLSTWKGPTCIDADVSPRYPEEVW
jgi:hypothetical protein